MASEDDYIREIIHTVELMTRQLVEFRQDITRAMAPMYPRIVEVEKRIEQDARERHARQQELDRKLESARAIASQQGAALQQVTNAVKAQGETLEKQNTILARIYHWQFWGRVFDIVLIGGLVVAVLYWMFG